MAGRANAGPDSKLVQEKRCTWGILGASDRVPKIQDMTFVWSFAPRIHNVEMVGPLMERNGVVEV